tara:strand:+ start:1313 stop:1498 length:186 start_codon:yes stop_codon:yes gene_type:complete
MSDSRVRNIEIWIEEYQDRLREAIVTGRVDRAIKVSEQLTAIVKDYKEAVYKMFEEDKENV